MLRPPLSVQALWSCAYQLTPAATVHALNALMGWTLALPSGLLARALASVVAPPPAPLAGTAANANAAAVRPLDRRPGATGGAAQAWARPQQAAQPLPGSLARIEPAALLEFVTGLDAAARTSGERPSPLFHPCPRHACCLVPTHTPVLAQRRREGCSGVWRGEPGASCAASHAAPAGAQVDAAHLKALQTHLAGLPWKDVPPATLVRALCATSGLVSSASSAASSSSAPAGGDGAAPDAAGADEAAAQIEPALVFAAYRSLRSRLELLRPEAFAQLCGAVVRSGQVRRIAQLRRRAMTDLSAVLQRLSRALAVDRNAAAALLLPQVDMEFVEAYLQRFTKDDAPAAAAASPSDLAWLLQGLGTLASGATAAQAAQQAAPQQHKPRAGVLGPLMARCLQAVPAMAVDELLGATQSLAAMRLAPKDTQVRCP